MKVACLQFAPRIGQFASNIQKAEEILAGSGIKAGDIDLLVLPELAFSGYDSFTIDSVAPFLEVQGAGPTTEWARSTAQRLACTVIVGYPEAAAKPKDIGGMIRSLPSMIPSLGASDNSVARPVRPRSDEAFPYNFNAIVTVDRTGAMVHHHRKVHLYYAEEGWAREGDAFASIGLLIGSGGEIYKTTMGICMDLNNKDFTAPFEDWEFASSVKASQSQLAIVSMAWLSQDLSPEDVQGPSASLPHAETLQYWVARLGPLISDTKEVIVVLANRSGSENHVNYAGTSSVMMVGHGKVRIFGTLGKGQEALLVVDTAAT